MLDRPSKTDNGSEFVSKVMDKWAHEQGSFERFLNYCNIAV